MSNPLMMGNWSQMHQRRHGRWTDQHGRKWWAQVEIKTGEPCDRLHADGWHAPLMPPPKYLKVDLENPGTVAVRYEAWVHDLKVANKEWVKKANVIGMELYKDQYDPDAPYSAAVLLKAGPRPHAVEPVLAAKQGNKWVLGLLGPDGETPKMPAKLAQFFVKPVEYEPTFEDEYEDEAEPVVAAPRSRSRTKTAA